MERKANHDIREQPAYGVTEAAHYLRLPPATLSSWTLGRDYETADGTRRWKPLIQSGPKAPPSTGIPGVSIHKEFKLDPKAKLPRKELDRYREILLAKRNELVGDVANMEEEALRQSSGSLSNLPQHMAEQGSDTCDQSLSLDLAQVDRNLIKEIEEALKRIDDGTFGVCLRTGKRISAERLAEVPWAKYSIEAAREMEKVPFVITARSAGGGRSSGGGDDD